MVTRKDRLLVVLYLVTLELGPLALRTISEV